jgi:hypothetical protein
MTTNTKTTQDIDCDKLHVNLLERQLNALRREANLRQGLGSDTELAKSTDAGLASRFNSGKPGLNYVLTAPNALAGIANVMEYGKNKYARNNWRKGLVYTEIVDSLLRHAAAFMVGKDIDEESGLPHVDHMLCNALFLAEMVRIHPELDDRD